MDNKEIKPAFVRHYCEDCEGEVSNYAEHNADHTIKTYQYYSKTQLDEAYEDGFKAQVGDSAILGIIDSQKEQIRLSAIEEEREANRKAGGTAYDQGFRHGKEAQLEEDIILIQNIPIATEMEIDGETLDVSEAKLIQMGKVIKALQERAKEMKL
jgi:hypothetical protein